MAKKILLIENDSPFAGQLGEFLEASGFDVRAAPEGKGGLDLAREWGPDAIVLCVELPGMSGYLVCQKLRKDDATRSIPLVLTSAEATPDTFEKHKALKVRADEYLIKPFVAGGPAREAGGALGAPPRRPEGPRRSWPARPEELHLEEEMGLDAHRRARRRAPSLDLESLPDEPATRGRGRGRGEPRRRPGLPRRGVRRHRGDVPRARPTARWRTRTSRPRPPRCRRRTTPPRAPSWASWTSRARRRCRTSPSRRLAGGRPRWRRPR